ncbi:MAG TPA: phosphorylated adapter RNA export RNA-binding domain-containing protein [Polyangiaceae bacterium]|nr:phosphorylated adapter RNA export RNA-binding domain-containing protein [Polyangiaceae bacterium]
MATEDTVSNIAKSLGEADEIPLTQIAGIVRVLGEEGALALLNETQEIEKGGGMLLADGTRRRSPGGVFFQLARRKLPIEERKNIFREKKPAGEAPPPSSRPGAQPQTAAATAADATRFPRRRVVEVVPARAAGPARGAKGFTPPELPSALTRARIRQQVTQAVAPLPLEEQYHLLLDLLADIHDRATGGANPPPSSEDALPSRARSARRTK